MLDDRKKEEALHRKSPEKDANSNQKEMTRDRGRKHRMTGAGRANGTADTEADEINHTIKGDTTKTSTRKKSIESAKGKKEGETERSWWAGTPPHPKSMELGDSFGKCSKEREWR